MEPKRKKKIIDLTVIDEFLESGVSAIALVEEPAIEVDFFAFKKEQFVEPRAGEKEDEFIGRCMSVLVGDEGKDQDQAAAICYSYWENKMAAIDYPLFRTPEAAAEYAENVLGCSGYHEHIVGEDTYYMPCETHPEDMDIVVNAPPYIEQVGPKKKKPILETKPVNYSYAGSKDVQETILAFAKEFGITEDGLRQEFANAYAYQGGNTNAQVLTPTDGTVKNLYRYTGGISGNSRDFCVQMIGLNKYYTYEEVQAMSNIALNAGFGENGADTYDIWLFKGGPNCKHHWEKYFASIQEGEFRLIYGGKVKGRPGTNPINMPNQGYVNPPGQFAAFETEDQRILVGPAMIPDMEIPRKDADGGLYYVQFSEDAVAMIAEKFMREQSTWNTNQDHNGETPAQTYVFESWIIENPETDKAKTVYGYEGLPRGTWMVKMRVADDEVWTRVKNGELKGFSVEGNFVSEEELAEIQKEIEMLEAIKRIVR